MKKSNYLRVIIIALTLIFIFSGCSIIDFFSADSLLRAPKLTGENAALQHAVEDAVGIDISLFTPIAGDYRSSYVLFDYNDDGVDEAVVFYSFNSNASVVHMHLLAKSGDKWYSVSDLIGSGTDVYKVDFFNIDSQTGLEIAVTWSLDESRRENALSIYKIFSLDTEIDNSLLSVATIQLADYVYLDIDSDSVNELLYFYNNNTDDIYSLSARVLDYVSEEKTFLPISEITLSQYVLSFIDIKFEKENNNYIFYLDCESTENRFFTEVMVYDYENAAIYLPLFNNKPFSENTFRTYSINCSDFNNDGRLDIPCALYSEESYITGNDDESLQELSFVSWYNFRDNSFIEIKKSFVNTFDGYYLDISDLYEYYYFVYDISNNMLQARLNNLEEEKNLVFSIFCEKSNESFNHLLSEFTDAEYEIVISAKGESMNFSKSFIRNLIDEM